MIEYYERALFDAASARRSLQGAAMPDSRVVTYLAEAILGADAQPLVTNDWLHLVRMYGSPSLTRRENAVTTYCGTDFLTRSVAEEFFGDRQALLLESLLDGSAPFPEEERSVLKQWFWDPSALRAIYAEAKDGLARQDQRYGLDWTHSNADGARGLVRTAGTLYPAAVRKVNARKEESSRGIERHSRAALARELPGIVVDKELVHAVDTYRAPVPVQPSFVFRPIPADWFAYVCSFPDVR